MTVTQGEPSDGGALVVPCEAAVDAAAVSRRRVPIAVDGSMTFCSRRSPHLQTTLHHFHVVVGWMGCAEIEVSN